MLFFYLYFNEKFDHSGEKRDNFLTEIGSNFKCENSNFEGPDTIYHSIVCRTFQFFSKVEEIQSPEN